ncbi:MAG: pilus assembly protein [Selenomonadaceae bacterium]|nr:pilus assembly protein [Selenomonadaceae bacterium]
MRKQHGQSAVEFALMAPIIFMMIFGMIYGGIMFMQYMHYSNAVRTAARQIAVIRNSTDREKMRVSQANWLKDLWEEEISVKLYKPAVNIEIVTNYKDDGDSTAETQTNETQAGETSTDETSTDEKTVLSKDVVIDVTFVRVGDIPVILDMVDFPPKTIKTIEYRMRVEESSNIETTTTTTTTTDTSGDSGDSGGLGAGIESGIGG